MVKTLGAKINMKNILFNKIVEKYKTNNKVNETYISLVNGEYNTLCIIGYDGQSNQFKSGTLFKITVQVCNLPDKLIQEAVVVRFYTDNPEDRTGCDVLKDIYDMVDWFNDQRIPVEINQND